VAAKAGRAVRSTHRLRRQHREPAGCRAEPRPRSPLTGGRRWAPSSRFRTWSIRSLTVLVG